MKIWQMTLLNALLGIPFWFCLDAIAGDSIPLFSKNFWWGMLAWMIAILWDCIDNRIRAEAKRREESQVPV
jgi:hypothetical protein